MGQTSQNAIRESKIHLNVEGTPGNNEERDEFYVQLAEKCKRQAAKEVNELKNKEDCSKMSNGRSLTVVRIPRYLNDENLRKIESHLSEYYMETVCQKLWQNAQNAVYGVECIGSCS